MQLNLHYFEDFDDFVEGSRGIAETTYFYHCFFFLLSNPRMSSCQNEESGKIVKIEESVE